jgi:hypothetical protein
VFRIEDVGADTWCVAVSVKLTQISCVYPAPPQRALYHLGMTKTPRTVKEMRDGLVQMQGRISRQAGTGNGRFCDLTRAEPPRPRVPYATGRVFVLEPESDSHRTVRRIQSIFLLTISSFTLPSRKIRPLSNFFGLFRPFL